MSAPRKRKPRKTRPVYRVVYSELWTDEKFLKLTPLAPSGQGLMLALLTRHENGPIPGLLLEAVEGLARRLRWPIEAMQACVDELVKAGMLKIDADNCIIWLVNGIKKNPPANSKQVKSWRAAWQRIPPCPLRDEIARMIWSKVGPRGPRFADAVGAVLGPEYPRQPASGEAAPDTVGDTVSPTVSKTVPGTGADRARHTGVDSQESRIKNQEPRSHPPGGPEGRAGEQQQQPPAAGSAFPGAAVVPPPAAWITDPAEARAVVLATEGRWMPCDHSHLQKPAQAIIDRWRELSGSANVQGRALAAVVKLLAHRIAPELLLAAAKNYGDDCNKNNTAKRLGALSFYGEDEWRAWLAAPAAEQPRTRAKPLPDDFGPNEKPLPPAELAALVRKRREAQGG